MVSKKQRVTKTLFDRAFKKGVLYQGVQFYVRALIDEKLPHPHYAVVVPKKTERQAVKRNTLKRRWYAALKQTDLPPGIFIFFLKKGVDTVSFEDVSNEITKFINDIQHI